jgi:acetylornithine/LysW-gamma-L-lysine aminotransferase
MMPTTTFETIQAREDAHTSGAYPKRPLALVRGEGVYVWDADGQRYLDATSGQGVALLGHAHPAIVQAVSRQAGTLITCPEIFYNDRRAELYALLADVFGGLINRFFLCNSGAEAVEGALKVARLLTGRGGVVAVKRGFHGRTLGALSTTWNKKYREPFADWLHDVTHISAGDMDAARASITDGVGAVIVEAVQGEGGVYPLEAEYLRGLRDLCSARGALLIVDEIQAGLGRTGRWFAYQHAGITPDIVTLGKGLAGGLPMGAVCWRGALGTIDEGTHGSTFGGNPLTSAAAIATLTTLRDAQLIPHSAESGAHLIESLRALNLPSVREVRGIGLMIGLELRDRVTPALKALQARGVLALPAGVNVLRLLPPLVMDDIARESLVESVREVLA